MILNVFSAIFFVMNKKTTITIAIVIVVILAGFFGFKIYKNIGGGNPSPTPTVSVSPSPSDLQSLTPQQVEDMLKNSKVQPDVDYSLLTKPATCQIAGTIKFLNPTLYENHGNQLTWTGIDSAARQIKWTVSPQDGLKVGPNLINNLKIPNGSSPIDVTLPASPNSKTYTLSASMTYGRLVNGDVKIYEVKCSGSTKVETAY